MARSCQTCPYSMVTPSFLHDFAITKKIFADIQIGTNPIDMITIKASPVGLDPSKVPRIEVIPQYEKDESEMRWFDRNGLNITETVNYQSFHLNLL
ncbi:unnamed protein product [Prunus armeniaca]